MAPVKNHVRLIEIFDAIHAVEPTAVLLLLGRKEPNILEQIQTLVANLALERHVFIAGEREDVTSIVGAADTLIFPSKSEGMPGAVLEACAVGTPVVASDLDCIQEIACYLPETITCVSLETANEVWGQICIQSAETSKDRKQGQSLFKASPFDMGKSVDQYLSLWSSARSGDAHVVTQNALLKQTQRDPVQFTRSTSNF